MNSYRVQREFTTWEEAIVEAESEEEALEKAKSDLGNFDWDYIADFESTGNWDVLPAEPTWADIGI
jgi:hypothetical protein